MIKGNNSVMDVEDDVEDYLGLDDDVL